MPSVHAQAEAFHCAGAALADEVEGVEGIHDLAEEGIETLPLVVDNDESILSCFKSVEQLTQNRGLDYLGELSWDKTLSFGG